MLILCQGERKEFLFVPPYDPVKEKWYGRRLKVEEASELSGIRNVVLNNSLESRLHAELTGSFNDFGSIDKVYLDLSPELKIADHTATTDYAETLKTNGFAEVKDTAADGTETTLGALTVHVAVTPEPVDYQGRTGLSYRRVRPGEVWAKHVYDCGWFHVTGDLPENALTDDAVMLQLRIGGEGLVYTNGGEPFEMISAKVIPADNLTVERGKSIVPLTGALTKDGRIDFYMDAGFNGSLFNAPFGVGIFRCAKVVRAALRLVSRTGHSHARSRCECPTA